MISKTISTRIRMGFASVMLLTSYSAAQAQDLLGQSIADRERAAVGYAACLDPAIDWLNERHPGEPAETIIRSAEAACEAEWSRLETEVKVYAFHEGALDGNDLAAEWKDRYHNRGLYRVLGQREQIPGEMSHCEAASPYC